MPTDVYAHCRLHPAKDAIRLLRLHPSLNCDESLVATLFSTTLTDSEGQYEALSYCWGDETARGSITLQTASLSGETEQFETSITQSLADALTNLRLLNGERVIWADALCINQSDDEEKSTQVAQMFEVYRCSSRTVAYLGPDSNGMYATAAFRDYLRALNGDPVTDSEASLVEWDPNQGIVAVEEDPLPETTHNVRFKTFAIPLKQRNSPVTGRTVIHSIESLRREMAGFFTRPWFSRAWTTQEFIAGPDVVLQVGSG